MSMLDVISSLDELLTSRQPKGMSVRNLWPGELLPANLPHGLPADYLPPQPDWCWLVTKDSQPIALLIAGPVQNLVYLMRICAAPQSSASCLVYLLRHSFWDMVQRGYNGYVVQLDPETADGKRMLSIARRASRGSKLVESLGLLVGGSTQIEGW